MTSTIIMPQLGETVAEGKVLAWFKSIGDEIRHGDNLFEVETDKVTIEVQAVVEGRLSEIRVGAGATAKVGEVVAVIDGDMTAKAPGADRGPRGKGFAVAFALRGGVDAKRQIWPRGGTERHSPHTARPPADCAGRPRPCRPGDRSSATRRKKNRWSGGARSDQRTAGYAYGAITCAAFVSARSRRQRHQLEHGEAENG